MIEGFYFSYLYFVYAGFLIVNQKPKVIGVMLPLGILFSFATYLFHLEIIGSLFGLMCLAILSWKHPHFWFYIFGFCINSSLFYSIRPFMGEAESFLITDSLAILILFFLSNRGKYRFTWVIQMLFLSTWGLFSGMAYFYLLPHYYLYLLLMTLIFLLSMLNIKAVVFHLEETVNEYQNKMLQQHVEEVEHIYVTMRGWRHDYHNHLQTLKAHLSLKRFELMDAYLNELENDLNQIETLVETHNPNVDAILNSKLSLAKTKQIDIHVKATVPEILSVSTIDLCVIIGNLLDNAIEACEAISQDEAKFIRVYIGLFKKQFYISVTNSTNEWVRKLDKEYITNKRGNHGHGLKRIDQVVEKNLGYVNRKNEPHVFVTEILLPL